MVTRERFWNGGCAVALAGSLALAGTAIAQGEPGDRGVCCGEPPRYEHEEYAAFGDGPVAVTTRMRAADGETVVAVIDLSDQGSAPINTNWNAASFFSDPSWTRANLGGVYGVTLDNDGNIYVAHSSIYSRAPFDPLDALGIGGAGAIYRLDAVSAAITVFATLPNAMDPGVSPASESWSGLGNLHYDCERDNIYVTNFEDGRIYRLDSTGACLSTYDHATDTVGTCAPEAGDTPGFVARSERVFGVQAHAGRVYYSIWSPSQIWSVQCDGSGNFVAGTQQLEVTVGAQHPVADISFGPAGCMLVGERTVGGDSYSGAHQSAVREYCYSAGSWNPSANTFLLGSIAPNLQPSSAGGVDYDYAPGGRVWGSGDALQFGPQYIYGIAGVPATGGDATTSILVDMHQEPTQGNKYDVGDVEITCPAEGCLAIVNEDIVCEPDGSGDYTYTIEIRNFSGVDAHWALVPAGSGPTLSPNVFQLVPPLPGDGSASATISLTISGGNPGDEVCFPLLLADVFVEECCAEEVCVTLPECDCLNVFEEAIGSNVVCNPDGTVDFDFCFTLQNLSGDVLEHAFIGSETAGVTFVPDYFDLASIPDLGSVNLCVNIQGATPGTEVCFLITVHDESLQECCSQRIYVTAPDCPIEPRGACSFCDGSCIEGMPRDECLAMGGFYCGDDVPCVDCVVAFPVSACCLPDGTCVDLDRCECEASNGIFDPTTLCLAGVVCVPPIDNGGCLFCDGSCLDIIPFEECVELGGSYCGDDVPCGPLCVVTPNGACCTPDGACFDTIGCECEAVQGLFIPFASCADDPCPLPACPGDCNGDRTVDALDLLGLIAEWGTPGPHLSDVAPFPDGDGSVDALDWLLLIGNWGPCD